MLIRRKNSVRIEIVITRWWSGKATFKFQKELPIKVINFYFVTLSCLSCLSWIKIPDTQQLVQQMHFSWCYTSVTMTLRTRCKVRCWYKIVNKKEKIYINFELKRVRGGVQMTYNFRYPLQLYWKFPFSDPPKRIFPFRLQFLCPNPLKCALHFRFPLQNRAISDFRHIRNPPLLSIQVLCHYLQWSFQK